MVKAVSKGSPETQVLRNLLLFPHAENRAIPAELVECENSTLVIMPFLLTLLSAGPPYVTIEQYLHLFTQMIDVSYPNCPLFLYSQKSFTGIELHARSSYRVRRTPPQFCHDDYCRLNTTTGHRHKQLGVVRQAVKFQLSED